MFESKKLHSSIDQRYVGLLLYLGMALYLGQWRMLTFLYKPPPDGETSKTVVVPSERFP